MKKLSGRKNCYLTKTQSDIPFRKRLSTVILFWFTMISLVPIAIVGFFAYDSAYHNIRQDIEKRLVSTAHFRIDQIRQYFDDMLSDLSLQSGLHKNISFLNQLRKGLSRSKMTIADYTRSDAWIKLVDAHGRDLKKFRDHFGYYDVFLIDNRGNILFTVAKEGDLGENLFQGGLSSTRFATACKKALTSKRPVFSDFEEYGPSGNMSGFLCDAMIDNNGDTIGVFALQFPISQVNDILKKGLPVGETAETYLIGRDLKLRSARRLSPKSPILTNKIDTRQTRLWHEHVNAIDARLSKDAHEESNAFALRDVEHSLITYAGPDKRPVLGMHYGMVLNGVIFAVISEISTQEVYAPLYDLRNYIFGLALITGLLFIVVALILSKRITRPLKALVDSTGKVAAGDFNTHISEIGEGEVGQLARSFNAMIKQLEFTMNKLTSEREELENHRNHLEERVDEQTKDLKANQQQYLALFDGIDDVIYVSDPDTYELIYVNESVKKIWGEDVIGKKCYKVLQNREDPCPFCTNDIIFGKYLGRTYVWEFQNEVTKDWFRCADKAIQWPDGRSVRFELASNITEQKKGQEEVIKERQFSNAVIDSLPGVFYMFNDELKFIRWNKNMETVTGYSHDEIANMTPLELFTGDDQQIITERIGRVFTEGEADAEAYFTTKTGNRIPHMFKGLMIEIDTVPYLVGLGIDITDRKKSESALKESEEKFRKLLTLAPLPLSYVDLEGKLNFINERFTELFGYTLEDVPDLDTWWPTAYPDPDYRQWVLDTWDEAIENAQSLDRDIEPFEYNVTCKDGSVRIIQIGGITLDDGFLATFVDMTARRNAEKILQENETKYRTLFESYSDAVFVTKLIENDLLFEEFNAAALSLFQAGKDELIGKTPTIVSPPTQPDGRRSEEKAMTYILSALEGRPQFFEWQHCTVNGEPFDAEVSLNSFSLKDEPYILGIVRDITERKQWEKQLKRINEDLTRSNQELEQFAYVASHDLQEPLRMVSSYTQLLAQRYKDKLDQDARDFIMYAVDGANRMQQLIQDLLAYSRVTTRGNPLEPVDTNNVVGEAADYLNYLIADTGATITTDGLPTVHADRSQLVQVFQNLIHNAIKYQKEGEAPAIHISANHTDHQWRFSVQDNGIGIDKSFQDRVFIIFQRLHSKQEYSGTGIGLAKCKRIIERHGGRIWFESEPGHGTTFFFTLPGEKN